MSTNFPTSLDTLTNPTGTDALTSPSHAAQHANANDAVEAIEAKVGIGASTPVAATFLQGTGTGVSTWQGIRGPVLGLTIAPTTLAATTHNWNPTGLSTAHLIRMFASGAIDLTGIVGTVDGHLLHLVNAGANTITLKHNSGSSSVGNRFLVSGAGDLALATWGQIRALYSAADGFWLLK